MQAALATQTFVFFFPTPCPYFGPLMDYGMSCLATWMEYLWKFGLWLWLAGLATFLPATYHSTGYPRRGHVST